MLETSSTPRLPTLLNMTDRSAFVEHVPAKVSPGDRRTILTAPETVERILVLIKGRRKPDKVIETPVYEYAGADA